jgi:hypothetical protein
VEENSEEVQSEPEEEDPEEVEMEEEEPDEPLEQPQLYDGTVLEADIDGNMVIPPAPVANEEAPPAHDDPVPDGEGGDLDDSSDDSVGEEAGNNADDNPEEDPRYHGAEYHKHSTEAKNGQFCILLWEVLQYLGYTIRPLYVTKHFTEPGMRDYYTCRVYIRKPLNDTEGWRYRSSHHSTAQFSTEEAAVNDAITGLPVYRLLKKHERFSWTVEAQEALENLNKTLAHALILTPPQDGEPLYLYVTATTQVVSAVNVVERTEEGHTLPVQRPVYYINEMLSETKVRYPQIQKLLYAVVLTQRKLRHYFEAQPVTVVSSFPLGEIIRNPDAAGRIAKWSVELMGETLAYAPRKAIKSQILEDFVVEWMDTQLPLPQIQADCWTLYFDGSLMKTGAGAGLLFISPLGEHMRYAVRLHFPASNNMAGPPLRPQNLHRDGHQAPRR